jgi:hypothetical protein
MVLKTFIRSTELDTSQLFEFKDNDKNWGILTENGCVDWSPAYVYGNHNWTGNQNNGSCVLNIEWQFLNEKCKMKIEGAFLFEKIDK